MKELNFNFLLKGLDGQDIPDSNAGKILSTALANDNGQNPVKVWAWAQECYKGAILKLDPSDVELLKSLVTNTSVLPSMTKAQILAEINK